MNLKPKNRAIVPHRLETYSEPLERLFDDWEERILDFRKQSLEITNRNDSLRMRGKADTLAIARAELMLALEEEALDRESDS